MGLDVDIVTTLGEKERETLRKMVIATMHMFKIIIFMNEQIRESASADSQNPGKFSQTSHGTVLLVELVRDNSLRRSRTIQFFSSFFSSLT